MKNPASVIAKSLVLGLALILAVSVMERSAEGAVGDVLQTVFIPGGAQCNVGKGSESGSAIAIVQGSKVGYPNVPVVLVISCAQFNFETLSYAAQLRFLAPGVPVEGTSTAELLKTINTTVNPGLPGWRALALRADTGDMLACIPTEGGTQLYAIDISIFNNNPPTGGTPIPDGTTTFLRNGPANSTCAGIAWDPTDKAIFQASTGANIFRIVQATGATTSIPSGCTNGLAGLAFAGPSLFVGCLPPAPAPIGSATPETRLALRDFGDTIVSSEFTDFLKAIGVVLVGTSPPPAQIFQINKFTGVDATHPALRTLTAPTDTLTDLECDAASFGASFKDAVWVNDPSFREAHAVEIPAGTCSLSGTIPLLGSPGACPNIHPVTGAVIPSTTYYNADGITPKDTDGDGLYDCWEDGSLWPDGKPGISFTFNANGTSSRDIKLCIGDESPANCADKNVKDIFVEFDSMTGHSPKDPRNPDELGHVVTAFANAPVASSGPGSCVSGTPGCGIRLHIQVDDQNIPHSLSPVVNLNTAMPPCTPPPGPNDANFDTLKKAWFGTSTERTIANLTQRERTLSAKKLAFRYGIGVHTLTRDPATSASPSGCAEVPGNDFVVALGSLGSGTHKNGISTATEFWGGALMHELGHTLGLRHGGGDNTNCKPNYLSIMSYPLQFKNLVTGRPLDYSRQELPALDKTQLREGGGIRDLLGSPVTLQQAPGAPTPQTVYGGGTGSTARLSDATLAVNWNTPSNTTIDLSAVSVEINQIGNVSGCDGSGGATLLGYNDWSHLVYNFRATVDFADGSYGSSDEVKEITDTQVAELTSLADADADGAADTNSCGGAACAIDIVPGLASNKVLLFSKDGVPTAIVPVAILSSAVFDATMVDVYTLKFAATPVLTLHGVPLCARLDVNGDGRRDLVCAFELHGLSLGEQAAILEGGTLAGVAIRAEGTMVVVKLF